MSGDCATCMCHSDCRTEQVPGGYPARGQRLLLPSPDVFQGTEGLSADVWLSCPELREEQCALRKLHGEQAPAVATAPCSKTSKGALGLEKDIKNS